MEPIGDCFISVDGTYCLIDESSTISPTWYTYKSGHVGSRYEVAVSIKESSICLVFGPFFWGWMNCMSIYSSGLHLKLQAGENIVTDGGYHGSSTCSATELALR